VSWGDRHAGPWRIRVTRAASSMSTPVRRYPVRRYPTETWTSLGQLPAGHIVPLPARSIATVVLQGRMP